MKNKKPTITIIGAGLTGCFMATLLAKRGYKVSIYERFSKKEILHNSSKRSFNLTFYNYAVQAFKKADLWNDVKPILVNLEGSTTQVTPHSAPVFVRFNNDEMSYFTVERTQLLKILVQRVLKNSKITIHFEKELLSIDRHRKTMTVKDITSNITSTIPCEVILGCDGVNSQVQLFIQQGQQVQNTQEFASWNYKQISLSKKQAELVGLNPTVQHSWTRHHAVLIAFPNVDGSFNALLTVPNNAQYGFRSLTTPLKIQQFISAHFPDMLPILPTFTNAILNSPEGHFTTKITFPWYYKDFAVILGDAAHGLLPFYGIGMSVAFTDCMKIVQLLDRYGPAWEKIFQKYQLLQKQNTDVIAVLAQKSFEGFKRHKKADYTAIYDRVESILHQILPHYFHQPLFHLVTAQPYRAAEFYAQHQRQRRISRFLGIPLSVIAAYSLFTVMDFSRKVLNVLSFQEY